MVFKIGGGGWDVLMIPVITQGSNSDTSSIEKASGHLGQKLMNFSSCYKIWPIINLSLKFQGPSIKIG